MKPEWSADMKSLWMQAMRRFAFEFVKHADAEQLRKLSEFVALRLSVGRQP